MVELPYLPVQSLARDERVVLPASSPKTRAVRFVFVGRLRLWILDRVCSLRNAVVSLANRTDTLVANISEAQSYGRVIPEVSAYFESSMFCLITRSDSYSSASFYNAIQAGCIPIVISDWFVFAYYWFIPYSEFVIRVRETDFLKDPHGILNAINTMFNTSQIQTMQGKMKEWRPFLSFEYQAVQIANLSGSTKISSIVPFELLLRELLYTQSPNRVLPNVPCHNPFKCKPSVAALDLSSAIAERRSQLCRSAARLIGHYKLVYFMQCSRILWPLRPGRLLKSDNGLTPSEINFLMQFHNVSGRQPRDWSYEPYPVAQSSLSFIINL